MKITIHNFMKILAHDFTSKIGQMYASVAWASMSATGMSRPLLNSAGRALPVDDAMRLSVCSQVSAWSYAWRDAQPAP
ncbi:MAG: hypothetical protein WBE08_05525, partial [Methyloceanibacter sp.]